MAVIVKRQRKDGTAFQAKVRIKGFPAQSKTFRRKTDADKWAKQTEAAIHKGEFKDVISEASSHTLKEVIKRYCDEVLPGKAANTIRTEKMFLNWWEDELGKYALSYITTDQIAKKITKLRAAPNGNFNEEDEGKARGKSERTIKYYRDALYRAFKHAVAWGWLAENPVDGIAPITKLNNARVRFLDEEERKALLKACMNSSSDKLYTIVVFALSTGARKGEIMGLTLDDVFLNRETPIAVFRDTKNRETRSVPLLGHLYDLMVDCYEATIAFYDELEAKFDEKYLFPRSDGLKPIDIRKPWTNACEAAQLIDFRFHDLRHTTASYMAMNGNSPLEIGDLLGHKTLQMVKRYAHLAPTHKKGVMTELDEKMFG